MLMTLRPTDHRWRIVAVACAAVAALAACGTSSASSSGGAKVNTTTGIVNAKDCTNTTQGVTAKTITFGLSHPESGSSAVTGKISVGVKAYFDYADAELGGVKKHNLELITKDDAAQPSRTVANVNEMLQKDKVFGFIQNLGTPNNLAIRNELDAECVPNLLISTGSAALVDPVNHPFTMIANATYAAEAYAFVDYVAKAHPGARIASITEDSDFGKSYRDPLVQAVKGKDVTLVSQQTYEQTDPDVTSQFTAIRAAHADALFIGASALKCPQSINAAAGQFSEVYLSANCTSRSIISIAKPAYSNGILSESASLDPSNPTTASDPRMKLYFAKIKQYAPGSDPTNSLIAYGWTEAAILREILEAAPKLDRVSVINTAHNLDLTDHPGLLQDGVAWKTSGVADPYPIESFRLEKWNSTKHYFVPLPELTSYEGRSTQLVSGSP